VEVTVTNLPASGALENVNRWRGQIGLGPLTAEQYAQSKQSIEFAGVPADYLQIDGAQESILGVIARRGNMTWFAKLQGSTELARRERGRFEDFVRSVRFE
jgi:hypothetical protein